MTSTDRDQRLLAFDLEIVVAAVAIALGLLAAGLTLHGAYSAFTWGKFKLIDYGRYVNMIWNCGHGRPFTLLVDQTYFSIHLSFTLALLGPFFWIWDHPFLLSLLQWLALVGGAALVWHMGTSRGVRKDVTAAIVFFFVANPFTQAVMLCEFHGAALFVVLMPWLYACLAADKRFAWLPLLLLLGTREEASLLVVPLLVIVAIRDRWRMGYVLAALAVGYPLFAAAVLFPLLSGLTFTARRGGYAFDPHHYLALLSAREIYTRAMPLVPCILVAAPFVRRGGWLPLTVFPLAAVAIAASAAEPNVYLLRYHYPAAIIVLFTLAVLDAAIHSRRVRPGGPVHATGSAVFLIVATLAWHGVAGFLPLGGRYDRIYGIVHPDGEDALRVANTIPKTGILLCPSELAGFCANRADLLTWETFDATRHRLEFVFLKLKDSGRYRPRYRAMLESGEFGVRSLDRGYAVFARGHPVERNAEVIRQFFPEDTAPKTSASAIDQS